MEYLKDNDNVVNTEIDTIDTSKDVILDFIDKDSSWSSLASIVEITYSFIVLKISPTDIDTIKNVLRRKVTVELTQRTGPYLVPSIHWTSLSISYFNPETFEMTLLFSKAKKEKEKLASQEVSGMDTPYNKVDTIIFKDIIKQGKEVLVSFQDIKGEDEVIFPFQCVAVEPLDYTFILRLRIMESKKDECEAFLSNINIDCGYVEITCNGTIVTYMKIIYLYPNEGYLHLSTTKDTTSHYKENEENKDMEVSNTLSPKLKKYFILKDKQIVEGIVFSSPFGTKEEQFKELSSITTDLHINLNYSRDGFSIRGKSLNHNGEILISDTGVFHGFFELEPLTKSIYRFEVTELSREAIGLFDNVYSFVVQNGITDINIHDEDTYKETCLSVVLGDYLLLENNCIIGKMIQN